ncbi:MAG: hypothetical protein JWR83_1072, partial [Aeromicrobium sp.]|nr:hypothetical protein [Aeromicrobium sp.]
MNDDAATPSGRFGPASDFFVRHHRIVLGFLLALLVVAVIAWDLDIIAAVPIAALGLGVVSSPRHLGETPSH